MKKITIMLIICCLLPAVRQGCAAQLRQIAGVIHLHTTFSSGKYALEALVEKARRKQIEVLIPTDHDLVVMEYGLFPLRNILKRREERNSVLRNGPENYLAEIRRLNEAQDHVLVLPGVQSSPFYYWTGHPLTGDLTAHDYRKELLLIGMDTADDYRHLPLLHNGFSTRYIPDRLPQAILFAGALGIGIYLLLQKGRFRRIGAAVGLVSLLLLIDQHPFQSSRFDPYHGDQGIRPYQETIDFVRQRNGLVFWAHPESGYAASGVALGPVKLMTQPYPDDMVTAHNYTGFAAVYGDTTTAAGPGRQWDDILRQYCREERDRPVWAIAGADFHLEKEGVELDTFQTVFLAKRKTVQAVLEALAGGRMYAVRKGDGPRLVLDHFGVKDPSNGATARMGEALAIAGMPIIEGRLSADDGGRHRIAVSLIRGGKIWQEFEGDTPLAFEFVDRETRAKKTYYRLTVRGGNIGKLLSNPVFVVNR